MTEHFDEIKAWHRSFMAGLSEEEKQAVVNDRAAWAELPNKT